MISEVRNQLPYVIISHFSVRNKAQVRGNSNSCNGMKSVAVSPLSNQSTVLTQVLAREMSLSVIYACMSCTTIGLLLVDLCATVNMAQINV